MRRLIVIGIFLLIGACSQFQDNRAEADFEDQSGTSWADSGQTVTSSECLDQGGHIVGGSCYIP
jgi:hypothetical protein